MSNTLTYLLSVWVSYTSTQGIDARALDSPALRHGICNLNALCTFGYDLSFDIPKCFVMTCDTRVFYLPITLLMPNSHHPFVHFPPISTKPEEREPSYLH
jgi:hypothetical protein